MPFWLAQAADAAFLVRRVGGEGVQQRAAPERASQGATRVSSINATPDWPGVYGGVSAMPLPAQPLLSREWSEQSSSALRVIAGCVWRPCGSL